MTFDKWWESIGQRKQCFTAYQWAKVGWIGHQVYHDPMDSYQHKLLLDKPNESCDDLNSHHVERPGTLEGESNSRQANSPGV